MAAKFLLTEMRAVCSWDVLLVLAFGACCCVLELDSVLAPHERQVPKQAIVQAGGAKVFVMSGVLSNPYVPSHEQVCPVWLLALISFTLPLGGLAVGLAWRQRVGDAAAFLKGFLLAMACTLATVDLVKNYVGYWRPYFYEECGFDASTGKCAHDTADAHKSFPSGHSSISFDAMLFLALYLLGKVNPAVEKPVRLPLAGSVDATNVLLLLAVSPLGVAFWVAASRVRENDHHPADVVGGAVIGAAWAVFWHSRYYPSIWHEDSAGPRVRQPPGHRPADEAPQPECP